MNDVERYARKARRWGVAAIVFSALAVVLNVTALVIALLAHK